MSIPTEAVILCGGQGTRLGLPGQKCMALANGQPFVQHLLNQLIAAGIKRVVIATGHKAEAVEKSLGEEYGSHPSEYLELAYSRESQPLGTGGALRLAAEQIKGDSFLCLNGDSYCDFPLEQFIEWFDLVDPDAGVLLVPEQGTQTKPLGLAHEHGGKWVNGGVYGFKSRLVRGWNDGSPPLKFGIEEDAFPVWRKTGRKLIGYQSNARWIDIGTPESLARAGEFFKEVAECSKHSTPCSPAAVGAGVQPERSI